MFRIYPKRAIRDTCLRLEIYGCQGKGLTRAKEKKTSKQTNKQKY